MIVSYNFCYIIKKVFKESKKVSYEFLGKYTYQISE